MKRLKMQRDELKRKLGLSSKIEAENDLSHLIIDDSEFQVKPKSKNQVKKSKKKGSAVIGEMESKKKKRRKKRKKYRTDVDRSSETAKAHRG
eukprot:TRINITY_DN2844_c0_g1_i1.p2 TRINITY_DN2844_c0_g1~~TRINITY_DN2844_c0_g1_i1.p2  ORF type:complete len:92 (-),score=43.47 TRINITY_DN2844_c0_g1_i1:2-277(-)